MRLNAEKVRQLQETRVETEVLSMAIASKKPPNKRYHQMATYQPEACVHCHQRSTSSSLKRVVVGNAGGNGGFQPPALQLTEPGELWQVQCAIYGNGEDQGRRYQLEETLENSYGKFGMTNNKQLDS